MVADGTAIVAAGLLLADVEVAVDCIFCFNAAILACMCVISGLSFNASSYSTSALAMLPVRSHTRAFVTELLASSVQVLGERGMAGAAEDLIGDVELGRE